MAISWILATYSSRVRDFTAHKIQGDPSGWLQPPVDFGLGGSSSYCSYQLPFSPGKMAELSQQEVVTIQMGHPVSFPDRSQSMGRGGDKALYTTSYEYERPSSKYPSTVTVGGSGAHFRLDHAPTGELSSVRIPSGHKHEFRVTPLVGEVVFR